MAVLRGDHHSPHCCMLRGTRAEVQSMTYRGSAKTRWHGKWQEFLPLPPSLGLVLTWLQVRMGLTCGSGAGQGLQGVTRGVGLQPETLADRLLVKQFHPASKIETWSRPSWVTQGYGGIGGLSEVLGWTEVQREENPDGQVAGGLLGIIKFFAVILGIDLLVFAYEQITYLTSQGGALRARMNGSWLSTHACGSYSCPVAWSVDRKDCGNNVMSLDCLPFKELKVQQGSCRHGMPFPV
eukprot:1155915-Pelagomonas_calceolata.AAC.7